MHFEYTVHYCCRKVCCNVRKTAVAAACYSCTNRAQHQGIADFNVIALESSCRRNSDVGVVGCDRKIETRK